MLRGDQLWVGYSGIDVLQGATIAVAPGVLTCLVGGNGSGKSTLLQALAGTMRPARGTVLLDDTPLKYTTAGLTQLRQSVQLVVQDPDDQLFSADVFQDVAFGPMNLGLTRDVVAERVQQALAAMDITHLAQRPTHQLSFGQRKRVTLAGALAMHPRALLLDEPTAGLDPISAQRFMEHLAGLRDRHGLAVVMATHEVDLAYQFADHVAVLHDGVITPGDPYQMFCDATRLERAGLIRPQVVTFLEYLRGRGLGEVFADANQRPRTMAEALDWFDAAGGSQL